MSADKADKKERLGLSRIMAYSGPAMPIAALGLPLIVHLPPFYISTVGLPIALVGLIFMVTRFWDVFTDPIMGWASDHFQTKWGRRRPWIAASVPIVMLASFMIFMPGEGAGWLYLLFWMMVLYVGWTMLTISHLSWGAEMSADYHQRSRIHGVREVFVIIGMTLALSLPILIQYIGGEDEETARDALAAMGWFIILLLPVTALIAVMKVPERRHVYSAVSWRESILVLSRSSALRCLLGTDFFLAFSLGIVSSMFIFIVKDVLFLESWVANIMLLCYFVTGFIFAPAFIMLAKRVGKHKAQILSSVFTIATLPVILFLPEKNIWLVFAAWFLLGINMAAGAILMRSMIADISDEDCIHTGSERMALFYAMLTMTSKIGLAFSIGIIYPLLGYIGFQQGGDNDGDVLWQVRLIYVVIPMLLNVGAIILMNIYPLDVEKQESNRAILEARYRAQSAE